MKYSKIITSAIALTLLVISTHSVDASTKKVATPQSSELVLTIDSNTVSKTPTLTFSKGNFEANGVSGAIEYTYQRSDDGKKTWKDVVLTNGKDESFTTPPPFGKKYYYRVYAAPHDSGDGDTAVSNIVSIKACTKMSADAYFNCNLTKGPDVLKTISKDTASSSVDRSGARTTLLSCVRDAAAVRFWTVFQAFTTYSNTFQKELNDKAKSIVGSIASVDATTHAVAYAAGADTDNSAYAKLIAGSAGKSVADSNAALEQFKLDSDYVKRTSEDTWQKDRRDAWKKFYDDKASCIATFKAK